MSKKLSRATLAVDDSFCSSPDFNTDAFLRDTLKAVLPHLAELYDTDNILEATDQTRTSDPRLLSTKSWFCESLLKVSTLIRPLHDNS